jgi:hypothetical protein
VELTGFETAHGLVKFDPGSFLKIAHGSEMATNASGNGVFAVAR